MRKEIFPERLEIRLTKEQFASLCSMAKDHNTTLSEMVRICIMHTWED